MPSKNDPIAPDIPVREPVVPIKPTIKDELPRISQKVSGQNLAEDNDILSDDDDIPEDRSQGTRSDLTLEESKKASADGTLQRSDGASIVLE